MLFYVTVLWVLLSCNRHHEQDIDWFHHFRNALKCSTPSPIPEDFGTHTHVISILLVCLFQNAF